MTVTKAAVQGAFQTVLSYFQYKNEKNGLQPAIATLLRTFQCKKIPHLAEKVCFHFDIEKGNGCPV